MDSEQAAAERGVGSVYKRFMIAYFPYMLFLFISTNFFALSGSLFDRSISVLLSSIVFLLLLKECQSPYLFVRRHGQQALLLGAMISVVIWFILALELISDVCLSLTGITAVWFFGGFRGLRQVKRGDCWLMKNLDGADQLPRQWQTAESEDEAQDERDIGELLQQFRKGTADERRQAVVALEKMGEVERF